MIAEELNKILHIIIPSINILVCLTIYGLLYPASKKYYNVSKSVRIYFMLSLQPSFFLLTFSSIFTGIYYFIFNTYETTTFQIFRLFLAYSSIQIRYSYFFIVISRIMAFVFYKQYSKFSSSTRSIIGAVIITHIASLLNGYIEYIRIFTDVNRYFFVIYIGVFQHAITLILCKVLHEINKQKYKSLAYQSSLSERHQIYKNIKILKTIWPIIFIFSIVSPLGPLAAISYRYFLGVAGPTSVYYTFYNLAFLLMLFWRLSLPNKTVTGKIIQFGKINSWGQIQPQTSIQTEQYFQDLENQWK